MPVPGGERRLEGKGDSSLKRVLKWAAIASARLSSRAFVASAGLGAAERRRSPAA